MSLSLDLEDLAACLCDTFDASARPLCSCGVYPGATPPYEHVDTCGTSCGMGYVSVQTVFPSATFPNPDESAKCISPMAARVHLGVLRCAPTMEEDGSPPSTYELELLAWQIQADADLVLYALQCCRVGGLMVLEDWLPLGPEGGAAGGRWSVVIEVSGGVQVT